MKDRVVAQLDPVDDAGRVEDDDVALRLTVLLDRGDLEPPGDELAAPAPHRHGVVRVVSRPGHGDDEVEPHRSLGQPGLGPRRISATLAQERWGGIVISPNGVWRILRRHGLNRRISRLSLVAGYAAPPGPERPIEPERHVEVGRPGELVGFDCFHVGRLTGTTGRVWQYTAIDLASSFVWAELHTTPLNPSARNTSRLARRVAADLARHGWRLERVLTDNGSEFRSAEFGDTLRELGVVQTRIHPGRPTSNGAVERVQRTILEECWRPSFARSLVPKIGGLERDLASYLRFYNEERAHTGRYTAGRTPWQTLIGARKMRPR